jgi:hypothetical protein
VAAELCGRSGRSAREQAGPLALVGRKRGGRPVKKEKFIFFFIFFNKQPQISHFEHQKFIFKR